MTEAEKAVILGRAADQARAPEPSRMTAAEWRTQTVRTRATLDVLTRSRPEVVLHATPGPGAGKSIQAAAGEDGGVRLHADGVVDLDEGQARGLLAWLTTVYPAPGVAPIQGSPVAGQTIAQWLAEADGAIRGTVLTATEANAISRAAEALAQTAQAAADNT